MNPEKIGKILLIASKDEEGNLKHLKQALKDNDYKLCSMGASLMLSQMLDMGMEQEQHDYWYSLALLHLPQNPSEALSE
jgi:hypothetical protein